MVLGYLLFTLGKEHEIASDDIRPLLSRTPENTAGEHGDEVLLLLLFCLLVLFEHLVFVLHFECC